MCKRGPLGRNGQTAHSVGVACNLQGPTRGLSVCTGFLDRSISLSLTGGEGGPEGERDICEGVLYPSAYLLFVRGRSAVDVLRRPALL
jgi:hypothetical protein